MTEEEYGAAKEAEAVDELTAAVKHGGKPLVLSDGTRVKPQPPDTSWTDGKSVVLFADTAEVEVRVVDDTTGAA